MNDATLEQLTAELKSDLAGQRFGRVFPLKKLELAVDFRLSESRFLFISLEPSAPRLYFIRRRLRDLEKQAQNPPPFFLLLRKRLSNSAVKNVTKLSGERVVLMELSALSELGQQEKYFLAIQLTGRSANLFLLDENKFILDSLRENTGEGQQTADRYAPPVRPPHAAGNLSREDAFPTGRHETLSEALDVHYLNIEAERAFRSQAGAAEAKIRQEIKKREKLIEKLRRDLENHGDAEKWKRFGDLILANLATAERRAGKIAVTDFFDENLPKIEIEAEENLSLTEAAEKYFKRYTKARNAGEEISKRLVIAASELRDLLERKAEIDRAIAEKDEDFFRSEDRPAERKNKRSAEKKAAAGSKARSFQSSEGFEILVGKGARDNDHLTFRVAKSNDLWLHAADYPGSHVVVRSRNREEIPQKTLIEAAQIAAFYSQAREESKVAVHYTLKKFVHKPKGAAAGLVNLASFKTILVEPKVVSGG